MATTIQARGRIRPHCAHRGKTHGISVVTITLRVMRLAHCGDLPLPSYQTNAAAGLDLLAAIADKTQVVLEPGAYATIPTGIAIALPPDHEAQVRPRSGLAARNGVTILNSPGTIDADYRGEICVILINHGRERFVIERGMRIAQLVVSPVIRVTLRQSSTLDGTERGTGGFGSTGL